MAPRKKRSTIEQLIQQSTPDDPSEVVAALDKRFGYDPKARADGLAALLRDDAIPGTKMAVLREFAAHPHSLEPAETVDLLLAGPEIGAGGNLLPGYSLIVHQLVDAVLASAPGALLGAAKDLSPELQRGVAFSQNLRGDALDPDVAREVLEGLAAISATYGLTTGWTVTLRRTVDLPPSAPMTRSNSLLAIPLIVVESPTLQTSCPYLQPPGERRAPSTRRRQ